MSVSDNKNSIKPTQLGSTLVVANWLVFTNWNDLSRRFHNSAVYCACCGTLYEVRTQLALLATSIDSCRDVNFRWTEAAITAKASDVTTQKLELLAAAASQQRIDVRFTRTKISATSALQKSVVATVEVRGCDGFSTVVAKLNLSPLSMTLCRDSCKGDMLLVSTLNPENSSASASASAGGPSPPGGPSGPAATINPYGSADAEAYKTLFLTLFGGKS